MPVHIKAAKGDIAERVVVAGDPARVEQIAGFLENAKIVNTNRGFLTYTGTYDGVRVTAATHGIGAPSATIAFEELVMLGAKVIVRLGTAGGLVPELHRGDAVVASGAAYLCGGNSVGMYVPSACMPASPHPAVTVRLYERARRAGLKTVLAPVFSSDAFYAEDPEFARRWEERGLVAVEMECAGLFALGWMRGVKTGALLVVSDSLVNPEEKEPATADELRPFMEKAIAAVLSTLVETEI